MEKPGMIIISHVYEIAKGVERLLQEVAKDVAIEVIGGVDKTEIGTSFDTILELVNNHSSDHLLAFYDLGSAKMNLEMVKELSDKSITIYDVPIVEGSYTAAALLQADVTQEAVEEQLKEMQIDK
ncbi:dihydroxyacetone kinase phosphoryl donor subunit DhaM [Carnobacterium funditum]|uniref:dihydroxyacetone kinase phosphoryl donor subunit DhaM n=1 Tax=Carnobacterium funditum TaxID=2752 RepID=UPI00054E850F|nr:dihydroxyacetone kinase phosphoryl donor subunit DhaM [Carnobacterium funditum]